MFAPSPASRVVSARLPADTTRPAHRERARRAHRVGALRGAHTWVTCNGEPFAEPPHIPRAELRIRPSRPMSPPDLAPAFRLERPLARTPLGDAWTAHAGDGSEEGGDRALTAVALAPGLLALVPEGDRLVAALRARSVAGGRAPVGGDAIVPLHDVRVAPDGRVVLLFPREERPPAGARLDHGKAFATPDIAAAARALGEAIRALHAAGERHGAVCPGLLHLGGGAPVRLLGHGVIDAFVEAGADRIALVAALGARAFAAPELARTGATPAADVYAMGATLYACMTGKPPFGGRTTALTMAAVLADEAITSMGQALPRGDVAAQRAHADAQERLTHTLMRAIERAPEDRWPGAAEFVRALDTRVVTPAGTPASRTRPAVRAKRAASRHGAIVTLVLLAAIASLVAALVATR
jgi:hypothetical protein